MNENESVSKNGDVSLNLPNQNPERKVLYVQAISTYVSHGHVGKWLRLLFR